SESEVAPGQAGDGAAESDGGTGASCVRSGHGDDQLRPARRLQTGLREPRQLGQSERRRLVEGVVPVSQRTGPMEGDNLHRLRDRKFLLEDKKRLCALALGTAVLGIVLMIVHAETCPFMDKP
ncbi:unnamed protein product, partial [Tetraodon nigroviridis]